MDDHEGDLDRANMAPIRSEPSQTVGQHWGEDTHICLDKQLPCLYPFPQRSQRISAKARFPSPLTRCDPSLARRLRFLGAGAGELEPFVVEAGPLGAEGCCSGLWAWLAATGSWAVVLGLFILRER